MASILTCDGQIAFDDGAPVCSAGWEIAEYTDSSNLVAALDSLIGFDVEVFAVVNLLLVTTWFAAFAVGKVARILGKV